MADADIGFNSDFLRGSGTPTSYAGVGQVIDMGLPELSRDTTEATHYKSPGRFKEYIGALRDGGEFTLSIQFADPAAMNGFIGDLMEDAAIPYRFSFPDATHWDFAALITKVTPGVPLDGRMTCEAAFKLSGQPAFVTAALA